MSALLRPISDLFRRIWDADRRAVQEHGESIEQSKAAFAETHNLHTIPQLLQFVHNEGGSVSTLSFWFDPLTEQLAMDAAAAGFLRIIGFKEGDDRWDITDKGLGQIAVHPNTYNAATIASAHS